MTKSWANIAKQVASDFYTHEKQFILGVVRQDIVLYKVLEQVLSK